MSDEASSDLNPLTILHEESHFLVLDKPAGLFAQAAPGIESIQTRLTEQIRRRDQHTGTPFVGLPHRLDRGTSGVMLIARNQRALSRFGEQFHSRKIGKYYLAAVTGHFFEKPMNREPENSELRKSPNDWTDYIRKVPDQPIAEICDAATEGAKLAQLTAEPLATGGGVTLLLIKLFTGRMHQIRIQAASRGLKILGDVTYGGPEFFDLQDDNDPNGNEETNEGELASMALHALRLEIRHPQNAKQMAFTAPPPPSWENLPRELRSAISECVDRSRRENNIAWNSI